MPECGRLGIAHGAALDAAAATDALDAPDAADALVHADILDDHDAHDIPAAPDAPDAHDAAVVLDGHDNGHDICDAAHDLDIPTLVDKIKGHLDVLPAWAVSR